MQLDFAYLAILQPDPGKAFEFSPTAAAKLFLKPHNIMNAAAGGDSFNFFYFSDYLKMHLEFHLRLHGMNEV